MNKVIDRKMKSGRRRAVAQARMKLKSLFKILFGKIFMYEKIFVLETSAPATWPRQMDDIEIRLLRRSDFPRPNTLKSLRYGQAESRLAAGHLCFIAEKGSDIANYTWVCFDEAFVGELERIIRLGPNCAYRYDVYTVPKYRGKGILPVVLVNVADYLFQNGITVIYDAVTSDNYSSLRAYEKIGSRKMGEVTLFRLFGCNRYKCEAETAEDSSRLKQMLLI